ncbi:MAG TPA: hypothetical protein VHL57_05840, partial [Flavobacteriales bacterium]|nr:hypothetical protein [Flavobacteriales bacterium]
MCIDDVNATGSNDVTLPAGTYFLLVDAEQTSSVSQTFNIQCAAPPACVAAPTAPTNGATGLCQPVTLSWPAVSAFPSATGYDVYLDAGNAMPTTMVASNQAGTTYSPGLMSAGTYSWKVVPRNASGAASGCTFWTFAIAPEPQGDRAQNAITINSLPATIAGSNRASNCFNNDFTTTSTPGNANAKAGRDVFYKVTTSSCTQRLSVGVCASSGGNSFLHLITQFGVNIANNDNTPPAGCANANSSSIANVVVSPNTTYYIVVESTTAANEFDFTLTVSQTVATADGDGDGTPDCADGCPFDPNKVDPGVCGCGFADTDTDLDGVEDCFDGCPTDPGKFDPGVCGCGVADVPVTWYADTDGDGYGDPSVSQDGYTCDQPVGYVADNTDDCLTVPGRQGDACNDGNPFTTGDVIDATCTCNGTPVPAHSWTLRIVTDGAGSETSWEIRDVPTNFLMASGGGYPNNSTVNQSVSIPDVGHFKLRVYDSGNNGIGNGGGYMLRDHNGNRVIDNMSNGGSFTSMSESPEGFFTPVGSDALRALDCDNVERWPFEMIAANENSAVSAQWQVGNQADDGYEFWFTEPNGTYSRHVFRSHATSGGYGPANAQRACKLGLSSWVTNPLPQDMLLNVRIRGRVNGVDQDWGPACRMKVDQAAANCHTTQLDNFAGPTLSCGVTGLRTNGSSRIWAKPVTRYVQATNTLISANRYRFHFVNVGENTSFDIVLNSYPMLIYPQYPFQLGATYSVTVQASFNGGSTYCPVGAACQIS